MNVRKMLRPVFVVVLLMCAGSAMAASGSTDFKKEIAKQTSAVDSAKQAGQISKSEQAALKKELSEITKLYNQYFKDKTITSAEAKALKVKLTKTDLNLFRKKYD